MEPRYSNSWTFVGLVRASVDLALSYVLLCGSAYAFIVSKFLSLFELFLPCPCKGILGFESRYICWHKLLIYLPMRMIQDVMKLALSRYPFDSVSYAMMDMMARENEADRVRILEDSLQEEKDARAALCLELEEERAAAETSADQAMIMISRLQEEKSSLEMEARQFQRTIEATIEYAEEEIENMEDILIKMELKISSLEKEIEDYRRMIFYSKDQFDSDLGTRIDNQGFESSSQLDLAEYKSITRGGVTRVVTVANEKSVYDVHVIDEKTESVKEQYQKDCGPSACANFD